MAHSAVFSTPVTDPRSNEALLFCSLKPDAIDSVAERGFMKVERLFGAGVYFMDNAYKGDCILQMNERLCSVYGDTSQRMCRPTTIAPPT
jgi:hypothetical protein